MSEGPASSPAPAGAPSLRRATVGMAVGTSLSRLTGVGRVFVLAYVLGFHRLADAYNLANTTPNMLFDVIFGGVLSATFIPVFVDRLTNRPEREAWRSISAVLTLAVVVLSVATVACWVARALDHRRPDGARPLPRRVGRRPRRTSAPSPPACSAGSCRRCSSTAPSVWPPPS